MASESRPLAAYSHGMNSTLPMISLVNLFVAFVPSLALLVIMHRWRLKASSALYASVRMLVQLLAVGYVLILFTVDLLYTALDPRVRHAGNQG